MKKFIRQYKLTIGGLSLLLAVILGVMFYFAHTALQKESMNDAQQTLESVAQSIDNIISTWWCIATSRSGWKPTARDSLSVIPTSPDA